MSLNVQKLEAREHADRKALERLNVDLTEDSLALAFADRYGDRLRYDHTRGKWLWWAGSHWKIEETKLAFHYARNLCREANLSGDKTIPKVRTAAAVETFAQADRCFAVTHEIWDRDPWLLCTPDGTVDLKTGELRKSFPDDLITKCTTIAPRSDPTPVWNRFLKEVTRDDDDLIKFLRRLWGYSLTGTTREQIIVFVYGPGGNGKGVLANALAGIMGDYHIAANMEIFTASKYDRHPTELARLEGARLVTASETEEGRAWAESRIKQLTGGDPIAARFMRRDFFQYVPEFKLIFQGNHRPGLNNVDDAARRRFLIVPFLHKPKTPDLELPEKLKAEYSGILHWGIEGCLDWQANGLGVPRVVRDETASYFADQDIFSQWLEECTDRKTENTGERTQRLFKNWADWMQGHGEAAGTHKSFKDRMRRAGYKEVRHTPGHTGKRGFVGLALKIETKNERKPYVD